MDPFTEFAQRQAEMQQRISSLHSLLEVIIPIVLLIIVANIVFALVRLCVACRGGGLRTYVAYLFNPIEFRERQREKIRAGFRNRAHQARGRYQRRADFQLYPGGDYQTQDTDDDEPGSFLRPMRAPHPQSVWPSRKDSEREVV